MGWIIVVIIIIIGLTCFMMSDSKVIKYDSKSKYGNGHLEDEICKYYGGFRTITNSKTCNIVKLKEEFIFDFFTEKRTVPNDRIKSCTIISEKELKDKVSAGKIFCFGLMALGMKKTEEVITEYCKIDIEDNDKSIISIIVRSSYGSNSTILNMFKEINGEQFL